MKLPFADVKRLAIAAQQPDANEQELQPADEVCTNRVLHTDDAFCCHTPIACLFSAGCWYCWCLKRQERVCTSTYTVSYLVRVLSLLLAAEAPFTSPDY